MTFACMLENMNRTTYALACSFGDLRERLPEAFDSGFGNISASEIEVLSFDLAQRLLKVQNCLRAVKNDEFGWAAASAEAMTEDELIKLAREMIDIQAIAEDAIDERKLGK